MHRDLSRQAKNIEIAEKYQKERRQILADNERLNRETQEIKQTYTEKSNTLNVEFEKAKDNLEYEYKHKFHKLEKENQYLHKVIDKFKETIVKFIKWICRKFDLPSEDEVIRDFEKETHTTLDVEKQVKKEERQKEFDFEL